jgi:hypothetical protein
VTRTYVLIAVVIGVLLAGCPAIPSADTVTSEPTDTTISTDTTAAVPSETPTAEPTAVTDACRELEPRDLPELPENLTQRTVVRFVEAYYNATHWNSYLVGKERRRASVGVSGYFVNPTETGYVVHLRYSHTSEGCDNAVSDWARTRRDFFLNNSILVMNRTQHRTYIPRQNHSPVPEKVIVDNGTIIGRWNESSR